MEDDQDTFAPWDAAALVVSGGIRGVRPVVGRLHVPQRRERLQQFAHVGPAGTLRKHVFTSLRARWTCWATGSTVSGVALLGGAGELPALDEGVDEHRGSALHRTQGTSTKAAAITYAHRPRGSMRSIQETESSPHRRFVSRVAPVCPRSRHSRDGRRFGATLCCRAGDGFCRTRPSSCRFRRDLEPIRPTARADSGSWMGSESILHRVPRTQYGQHGARRQGVCPSLEVTSR